MVSDVLYLSRISHLLPKLKQEGKGRWWCRCPYCGDSKKDPNKRRGCFRTSGETHGAITFKCYNCAVFRRFRDLLKDLDPSIYRDYLRESVKDRQDTQVGDPEFWNPKVESAPAADFGPDGYFDRLLSLDSDHQAVAYVRSRQIPPDRWSLIWYTQEFKKQANRFNSQVFENIHRDSSRIVFPIMSPDGKDMVGFQGRSLDPNDVPRYYTIVRAGAQKFYGLERIDSTRPVIITEGPIDSLFLDNSVALCGATNATDVPVDLPVFFFDQEPRNPQIVSRIRRTAMSGASVILLPDQYTEMDANEIAVATGMDRKALTELVLGNQYSGAKALLKLAQWART